MHFYFMELPVEIKVKPGKPRTEIINEENGILIMNVKGKAVDNEANKEIIRFFSKLIGKKVRILKGVKNKKKVIG